MTFQNHVAFAEKYHFSESCSFCGKISLFRIM